MLALVGWRKYRDLTVHWEVGRGLEKAKGKKNPIAALLANQ